MTIDIPPSPVDDTRKRLIAAFMEEVGDILDESKPFPRRLALLVKWSHTLYGLGLIPEPVRGEVDAAEVSEKAREMLYRMQEFIKAVRRG